MAEALKVFYSWSMTTTIVAILNTKTTKNNSYAMKNVLQKDHQICNKSRLQLLWYLAQFSAFKNFLSILRLLMDLP